MGGRNTLTILAEELAMAFSPLLDALRSPESFSTFMQGLGWEIQQIPHPLVKLTTPLESIANILKSGPVDITNIISFINSIHSLIDAIESIKSQPDNLFPTSIDPGHFKNEFPKQIIEHLIADYILDYHPNWGNLGCLLGIIEVENIPSIGKRTEYVREEIAWQNLANFLGKPFNTLKDSYHWNSPNFKAVELIENIAELLDAWSIDYYLGRLENGLLSNLVQGDIKNLPGYNLTLNIPIIEDVLQISDFKMGLDLLVLPKTDGIAILPYGSEEFSEETELTDTQILRIEGGTKLNEGMVILIRPGKGIEVSTNSSTSGGPLPTSNSLVILLENKGSAGSKTIIIGSEEGSRLQVGTLSLLGGVRIYSKIKNDLYIEIKLNKATIVVKPSLEDADSFLSSLLPEDGFSVDFDIIIGISSSQGFYFAGSGGLEISQPVNKIVGPIEIGAVTLALRPCDGVIPLEIGTTIKCEMGPIKVTVENLGLKANFSFPSDYSGNLGPMDLDMAFMPPKGIGLSIDTGVIKGGGYLDFDPKKEEYSGTLELVISGWLNLKGFGLINTRLPGGKPGFSMLVIITANFGETGYQLGYGFTLLKVGGLLGLNRTLKIEALAEGIRTNAISSLMFPKDIVANAPRIISDLRAIFPPQEDTFLIAPMAEIGWGTPALIRVSLGVIIELPSSNIAIVGVLKVALPSEQTPLLAINVGFLGVIQPSRSRLWFFARLFDSHLLGITIEGEAGLLMAWGDKANFVFSVGGFHPSFTPPPLPFPVPERITLNILDHDNARIRILGYFAVTSNTVQFGARAELYFGFPGFNVSGHMAFDALLQLSPFYFIVQTSFEVSLKVFGMGLFAIGLDLLLEGPTPWHVQGSGSLRILFFTIRVPIDITWGESRDTSLQDIKIMPVVLEEFKKPENWTAELPDSYNLLVTMRELDEAPGVIILHPLGTLRVSQRLVPLDVQLDKMGNKKISDYRRITVEGAEGFKKSGDTKEMFAMAQFQDISDAKKLSIPSYQEQNSGLQMSENGQQQLSSSHMVRRAIRYETVIIDTNYRRSELSLVGICNGLFAHSLNSNVVTKSALSKARKRQFDPFEEKDKIKLKPESYTVVLASTNQAYEPGVAAFESEASTRDYLQKLIRNDPNLVDLLQVIPQSECLVSNRIYVVGHKSPDTDSVASAIAYANLKHYLGIKEVVPAVAGDINKETKFVLDYFKIPAPEKLTYAANKKLILVDHNEMAEAVDKLDKENIIEIVDHHEIGSIKKDKKITILYMPVGSTGCIIADLYERNKVAISKEMAGLMMSAILSETLLFKSPTCTSSDKAAAEKLGKIAGVNPMQFGMDMLKAGSDKGLDLQYYPGSTSVSINRRKHMTGNLEKLRDIPAADVVAIMGHRAPGADYPSIQPSLKEMGEPDCPIRQIVIPTIGAESGDRIRYSQFTDSMYFAPAVPYWRSYWAAINCRGCDPTTMSGAQIIEARERDIEAYTKKQYDSEMTDVALCSMRGCTVHGHSLRLEENGMMFDMLARTEMGKDGNVYQVKDQVGIPLDRKIKLGKPMSKEEAKKRTTIFRADGISLRNEKDNETIVALHHIWELRSKWGFRPE